jgi:hypothetical protein
MRLEQAVVHDHVIHLAVHPSFSNSHIKHHDYAARLAGRAHAARLQLLMVASAQGHDGVFGVLLFPWLHVNSPAICLRDPIVWIGHCTSVMQDMQRRHC